jgi:hypothetical protein
VFHAPLRIQEPVARGQRAGDHELGFLAQVAQNRSEGLHQAETVAVRTNVGGEQEALMAANGFDEGRPIDRHGLPFLTGKTKASL